LPISPLDHYPLNNVKVPTRICRSCDPSLSLVSTIAPRATRGLATGKTGAKRENVSRATARSSAAPPRGAPAGPGASASAARAPVERPPWHATMLTLNTYQNDCLHLKARQRMTSLDPVDPGCEGLVRRGLRLRRRLPLRCCWQHATPRSTSARAPPTQSSSAGAVVWRPGRVQPREAAGRPSQPGAAAPE
jgi:hypothetical protein